MNKCRETNPIGWYKTAIACLTELYLQLKEEGAGYSSDAWGELKELAKKFALSLGFDALKVRQPLVGIHRYMAVYVHVRTTCACTHSYIDEPRLIIQTPLWLFSLCIK